MIVFLVAFSLIILTCLFLNKISGKIGVPALLLFLLLGMVIQVSETGMGENIYWVIRDICTVALIFVMFYGGFGTRWSSAKPVVRDSALLATVGVLLTASLTGLFCHFALKWGWVESFLMGSVISSTDAASVFSILRSKRLGLRNNTAPLIEVESGSNDPMSYMLTAVMISVLAGTASTGNVIWTIFAQMIFGAAGGLLIGQAALLSLRRLRFSSSGNLTLFILAVAVISYAFPSLIGGNGYLSAYIVGIILGNNDFPDRKPMINFFDGLTGLMQIFIFFMLGLLAHPADLVKAILPAILIFLFLTFVARPLAVGGILGPAGGFRKYSLKQTALVSFVGLRGAASIVFSLLILTGSVLPGKDIFSIVFCIVLISIAIQGSLIPYAARKLDMIDKDSDVLKTFSDYNENEELHFGHFIINDKSAWKDLSIKEMALPPGFILAMLIRDGEQIIPDGHTVLRSGDEVVFCARSYQEQSDMILYEHPLPPNSKWEGHILREYPKDEDSIVLMIRRGEEVIIPKGHTILESGDVLVIMRRENIK
ncbi:MAG: potassium/proton antiporter [Bacteroidales bacterium]|nr:potassium/proton antiporter [Bacteroidales bacterium]